jgi:Circularly permutated YpsA SLOG family
VRLVIRSGGQSGVDRAALDAAIALGIDYTGWCPHGGIAEDYLSPPGLLARYPRLVETPTAEPDQRTAWNVRDSDATLVLVRGNSLEMSPGTAFTVQCAEQTFLKPYRVIDLDNETSPDATRDWLLRLASSHDANPFWLNVAGPRESGSPGIYGRAITFLRALLEELA